MEYEAVVVSLRSREALRVHHELHRFNALTRRGDTRISGRGRPHTETNREHSGGNGTHADLAHLSPPVQLATATCGSSIPSTEALSRTAAWAAVMAITKGLISSAEKYSRPKESPGPAGAPVEGLELRPSDLSPNHNGRKARIATGITRLCELTDVPKAHIVRFRLGTTRGGSGFPHVATEAPLSRGFLRLGY